MQQQKINGYQLSPQQKRVYQLQEEDRAARYRVQFALSINGKLDIDAFSKALESVVIRNEIFRTSFPILQSMSIPLQVIADTTGRLIENIEWSENSNIETVFAASQERLFQARLARLSENEHLLFISLSAMCADAATIERIVRDLSRSYAAIIENESSGEVPIPYVVISDYLNEVINSEDGEAGRAYWKRLDLSTLNAQKHPFENAFPRSHAFDSRLVRIELDAGILNGLELFAQKQDVSLSAVLLACWQILRWRATTQPDLITGVRFDGRTDEELEDVAGPLSKYLPVAASLDDDANLCDFTAALQDSISDAAAWQECFEPGSRAEYFPFCFEFDAEPEERSACGITFSMLDQRAMIDKFKIKVSCVRRRDSLRVDFHYDASFYSEQSIKLLAGQFRKLAACACEQPNRAIAELEMLSDEEANYLIREFNDSGADFDRTKTLAQLFEEQVARTPDAVAVISGERKLTYSELNERANQLARYLSKIGVGPDTMVAICIERSLEMVVGIYGVLKCGGAYVPLDAAYPKDRLAFMLEDTQAPVMLTESKLIDLVPANGVRVVCLDDDWNEIAEESGESLGRRASAENLAYVIYTSGSTGQPKGVMISQAAISNHMQWMQRDRPLSESDAVLQKTPFSFDASVWEFFAPLLSGGRLVMARPGGHQDVGYLVNVLAEQEVTVLQLVPSLLRLLLGEKGFSECRSLRSVYCGGEPLTIELKEKFHSQLSASLINLYGPTEATIDTTFCVMEPGGGESTISIGRPTANTEVYLLDSKLRPAVTGARGELYIGGGNLARGYVNRPELTAEKFIPNPFGKEPGSRMYRTGDVARHLPGERVEFLGRADNQIKVRGFLIEPGDVEAALNKHESVKASLVMAREDVPGEKRLVGYIVVEKNDPPTINELRRFLKERVPEYMVPSAFVLLESFSLTPSGKIDRRALPPPGQERPDLEENYEAPRNALEEVLVAIWAQVLGVDQVGIHDNFFALGGDSIRTVKVVGLAKERGLQCSIQQVFQYQTIEELASAISSNERSPEEEVKTEPFSLINAQDRQKLPDDVEDAYPLTMLQLGMIYHMELTPDYPAYLNVTSVALGGKFDAERFLKSVQRAAARHAILRTSIDLTGYSEPLQLVHKNTYFPVRIEDLRRLSAAEQERVLNEFVESEKHHRFDLSNPPLLRFHIHQLSDDAFQFTLTEHHSIIDGWSLTSIIREVFNRYLASLNDEPDDDDSPLAITFRDYVYLERQALASVESQNFWKAKLEGSRIANLPRWPSLLRKNDSPHLGAEIVVITPELSDELKRLARSAAVPVKSVCLAAHLKALSLIYGSTDIITGLPVQGRPEDVDGERVRGLFLNTVPFRFKLSNGTWKDLLQEVFAGEREVLPYRRYPLAAMQRDSGNKQLFETLFNLVHFHHLESMFKPGAIEFLGGTKARESTNFTLFAAFNMHPPNYDLRMYLQYDGSKLCKEQVKGYAACYSRILNAMAYDPLGNHNELNTVDMLSESDLSMLNARTSIEDLDRTFAF